VIHDLRNTLKHTFSQP